MDIESNEVSGNRVVGVICSLFFCSGLIFSLDATAALQGDSVWLVEKGDNVYSIARNVFPDDPVKQRQFRRELIEENAEIFNGNANLMNVGQALRLPAFAVSQPVTAPAVATPVEAQQIVVSPVEETGVPEEPVLQHEEQPTPDPQDVIGHVVISVGDMEASNRGSFRKLLRHSEILKGDTISTSSRAYTQIRMKDGALLSLRPNTKLKITDYRFNGSEDGSERSFMELIAGGFRTITGYIGHRNKQNYRVKTSVATIGIRGTHYGLMLCADGNCAAESADLEDGIYGGVVDGSIVVENQSGISTFNNDQYFHVASIADAPIEQLVPPPVFHGRAETRTAQEQHRQEVGEKGPVREGARKSGGGRRLGALVQEYINDRPTPVLPRDRRGSDVIKDTPPVELAPTGAGVLIAFNTIDNVTGTVDTTAAGVPAGIAGNNIVLGTRVEDTGVVIKNLPVAMRETASGVINELVLPSGVSSITDIDGRAGNGFGVNWGRWSGNYVLSEDGKVIPSVNDVVHYIYSDRLTKPAELSQLAALGGLTMSETYSLVGGTTPTNVAGVASTLNNISVTADFVNGNMVDYSISAQDKTALFDMQATNIPFSQMNEFDLNPLSQSSCNAGCVGRASAAFVGDAAQGIMTTYSIKETAGNVKGANGAAFLTRDSAVNVVVPQL